MKAAIKKILGPGFLAEFRKWFPSAVQKAAEVREVERKAAFYGLFVKKVLFASMWVQIWETGSHLYYV